MKSNRAEREKHTIHVMIRMYCRGHHRSKGELCDECRRLLAYAMERIERCPFQDKKPACAKCSIHCYKPGLRDRVRKVMRYAGPRMMLYHPMLALLHYIDAMRTPSQIRKDLNRKTDR